MLPTPPQPPVTATAAAAEVPPFEPHPWFRGGHRQTIFARFWPWPRVRPTATYAEIAVGGGDSVSVLQSSPPAWHAGDPAVLMVHGLGGCARSPYMARVAHRLVHRVNARVIRMNLRGAGSGFGSSRSFYHGGITADLRRVAAWMADRAPGSPIALVGFSLGANLALKLAGEAADEPVAGLDCVVAANPPVDLEACCRAMEAPGNRVYDRNFVRLLRAEVDRLHGRFPDLEGHDLASARSLLDFDELYTAPRNGFRDARDYYASSSANRWIPRIAVPGLVVSAADDPFVPPSSFAAIRFPDQLRLEIVPHGGHLGYWSRRPWDGDRRWLDARITAWLADRWSALPAASPI